MQKNKDNLNIRKRCNVCGKTLGTFPGDVPEEALTVEKTWGYFSRKDAERHQFTVCEECYDRWTASFAVPLHAEEVSELL